VDDARTISPTKLTLLDGRLHLFRRPHSRYWWCGFHHEGTYIRTSTRCADLRAARTAAQKWYFLRQIEIDGGTAPVPHNRSFAAAAKRAIERYRARQDRGERSSSYVDGLAKTLTRSVIPFMGRIAIDAVNQAAWYRYKEHLLSRRPYTRSTLHQHKMAIRIVLVEAYKRGEISMVPQFKDDTVSARQATPRTWFEPREFQLLCLRARQNIRLLADTRWYRDAQELYDYIVFVANTGLRVGEARNLRFCDIDVIQDPTATWQGRSRHYLLIRNIQGKRGHGECKSFYGAYSAFRRILARRGMGADWQRSDQKLFLAYHRDMFRELLIRISLRHTAHRPPRKRDLMSLRHTYICHRLLAGASVYDIAANCRTSVTMIEEHYARWLAPRDLAINVQRRA
jgi:integrase